MLLAIIVGFLILRWVGKGFFTGNYRAEVFALAVVVAFSIGLFVPFERNGGSAPSAVSSVAVAPGAPAPPPPRDVSAACAAAMKPVGTAVGNIDNIGTAKGSEFVPQVNGFTITPGSSLEVSGWAGDAAAKVSAKAVCLTVDGLVVQTANSAYGYNRTDVAAAYNTPAMAATGFLLSLPSTALTPGTHTVGVVVVSARGTGRLVAVRKVRVT